MDAYSATVTDSPLSNRSPAAGGDVAASSARRTYTGKALERRQAWGKQWGQVTSEAARKLREG